MCGDFDIFTLLCPLRLAQGLAQSCSVRLLYCISEKMGPGKTIDEAELNTQKGIEIHVKLR